MIEPQWQHLDHMQRESRAFVPSTSRADCRRGPRGREVGPMQEQQVATSMTCAQLLLLTADRL